MKDFVISDPKAPRFRKKHSAVSLVTLYKNTYKELGNLTFKEFKEIIRGYTDLCREMIVTTRYGIELPENLGTVKIMSYKEKRKLFDIQASAKLGKLVTYNKNNTDGLSAKVYYTNMNLDYRFSEKELWKFGPHRDLSKMTSKYFPDHYKLYEECVPKSAKIKPKYAYKEKLEDVFNDYNEFDL